MENLEKIFNKIDNLFNSKYGNLYAYGIIFILCFFIMAGQNFRLEAGNDDLYHKQVVEKFGSAFNFMISQYENWNSRYFTSLVMAFVMDKNIWLWRILNTVMLCLLFIYSAKIVQCIYKLNSQKFYIILFGFFSIFALLPSGIWYWSVNWVTGSFNYLWPAASLVISLYYLFNTLLNKQHLTFIKFLFATPFVLYAANVEQSALILVTFFFITIIYSFIINKYYDIYILLLFVFGIISTYIVFASPAQEIRYVKEIDGWYPMFNDISLIYKMILGFSYTVVYGFLQYNYTTTILFAIILILIIKHDYQNKYFLFFLFLPLIYTLTYYIGRQASYAFRNWCKHSFLYNSESFSRKILDNSPSEPFISVIIGTILLVIILYFVFKIKWSSFERKYISLLMIAAAILSAFVLSFSPTVFASGFRIFFIPYLVYSIALGILFAELMQRIINISSNKFKIIYSIYILVGVIDVFSKVYR